MSDDWTRAPRRPRDERDDDHDDHDDHDDPKDRDGARRGREGFWERKLGKRIDALMPEMLKRTVAGSLGSIFMSDDGLRQTLSDLKMPKEMIQYVIQQADHTKREFMRLVARELRGFLEATDFYDEVQRILTSLSFEIRTEIRLIPNDQAVVKPDIRNRVNVKRRKDNGEMQDIWSDEEALHSDARGEGDDADSPFKRAHQAGHNADDTPFGEQAPFGQPLGGAAPDDADDRDDAGDRDDADEPEETPSRQAVIQYPSREATAR